MAVAAYPEHPTPSDDQELRERLHKVSRQGMQTFWLIIVLQGVVIMALLGAVGYLLVANANSNRNTERQISQAIASDDQKWCSTMNLLTLTPVLKPANAKVNPSREASYELYVDFETLKKEFNCD